MKIVSMSFIIMLLGLLFGCNSNNYLDKGEKVIENSGTAILIIKIDNIETSSLKQVEISSGDYFGNPAYLSLSKPIDTIKFATTAYMIMTASRGINSVTSFLINPNDTITLSFIKDTIIAKSRLYKFISYLDFYIFSKTINKNLFLENDSLTNIILEKNRVNSAWFSLNRRKSLNDVQYKSIADKIKSSNKLLISKEISQLDSLSSSSAASPSYKKWMTVILKMNKINSANTIDSYTKNMVLKKNYEDFNFIQDSFINKGIGEYKSIISINFVNDVILKRNKIKLANNQYDYDYKIAFDTAANYLTSYILDYVKFQCLAKIKEQNSNADFELYKTKFYNTARDTLLIDYVKKNLDNSSAQKSNVSKKDLFKGINGKTYTLSDIIGKSKVSYIDFWASWCVPCRKEMPFSFELHNKYLKSDIDFVYISIDEDFAKWKSAVNQMQMQNFPHNYLLINQKESSIVTIQKINTIPRYLIYNKKGEIAYKEAPSPSNPEVKLIIDELLKQ